MGHLLCLDGDMSGKNGQQRVPSGAEAAARGSRLRTIPQALEERPGTRSAGKDPARWLRRKIYERRIPYYKCDGRVLLDLADLDAFLVAERMEPQQ